MPRGEGDEAGTDGSRTAPKTPETQVLFRGPHGATGATREIKLTNQFKDNKGHGWLEKK